MLFDDVKIEREMRSFLTKAKAASLATIDVKGRPHAANVFYACDETLNLFWTSKRDSAHSLHVEDKPQTAVTIYAQTRSPGRLHGVQMHGVAQAVPAQGEAHDHAWAVYCKRYPFAKLPPIKQKVLDRTFYCFTPTWIRWIDNRRGFGWKVETELGETSDL